MLTFSIIKADTGGFVGHSAMHPAMLATAQAEIDRARGELLVDGQVTSCGDDLHLVMTHRHGVDADPIHELAWDIFQQTTAKAKELGLDDPSFDRARSIADEVMDYMRRHGPFEPHRLPLDEMEYTTMPALAERLADRWEPIEGATQVVAP